MDQNIQSVVQIDKRKGLVGGIIAAVSFLLLSLGYNAYILAIIFAGAFLGVGFLKLNLQRVRTIYAAYTVWTMACMVVLVLYPWYEIYSDRIWRVIQQYTPGSAFLKNGLFVLVGILFFAAVTGKWKASVSVVSAVLFLLVIINGYVYRFRGKEFLFADIFSAGTAMNVAAQYDLSLQLHTVCALLTLGLLLFAGACFPCLGNGLKVRKRLAVGGMALVLSGVFVFFTKDMTGITWNSDGTLVHGYYVNFYLSIRDYFVKEPERYSMEMIEAYEQEYDLIEADTDAESLPNIIIIMNESFADVSVLGSQPQTNQPVTPFWDSLQENIISGYALASVFGGGTADSEFEVLTSFSMQFFPDGSVPYQQYIYKSTPSLASLLNSYGYQCMATHPYVASGWSRPKVYPLLGFMESTFIEDYPQENLIRAYVSDQEMYEYILRKLEQVEDGPAFLFGITMQNHSPYNMTMGDSEQTISLTGYNQEYPQAEEYLSLIHQSDIALEYLLTELEKQSEDTVVLFFGDHFPQVEAEFYEELHGGGFDTLDSQMSKYTVPFFIWANYDIPEQTVECTSLNYLSRYLLEAAGIELPPYYQFLKDAENVIPAVNALGYYSKSAQTYLPVEDAYGEEAEWLARYEILQYNGMFDSEQRSQIFFGKEENSKD